jgi:ferric-dicitrate binding protein FerR (iron transport regulator)
MLTSKSPVFIVQRIQQLVEQRQQHQDAITRIDSTLERIGAALTNGTAPVRGTKHLSALSPGETPVRSKRRRRGRRRKFGMTAEASILKFVQEHKNPTTQEIKKHWTNEGRGGTADNALSLLVRQKKLKRTPLEDRRGSRFALL